MLIKGKICIKELLDSAVVEGERGGTPFHQIFCGWNGVPPNIVGVSRNGGAVAFQQMPCPNCATVTFCKLSTQKFD